MITSEDFAVVVKAIEDGETISNETGKELVRTLMELDANLVILQNALELAVENAHEIIPAVAERVLTLAGRTDSKAKKKAAKYAAEVTARYEIALQMYLAGAAEKAREMLDEVGQLSAEEETTEAPQEATNE